jgi:RNA polymerase sigma factor, sigma-70 family
VSRLGSKRARREFEESVYTLAPKLYRLAFARLGHVHDAEDVVQETYLKAFKNIDSYRPGTNIEAWLSLILLNTIRDHLRHIQKSAVMVPLDENEDLSIGFTDSPEMRLERNEVGADVLAALKASEGRILSVRQGASQTLLLCKQQNADFESLPAATRFF